MCSSKLLTERVMVTRTLHRILMSSIFVAVVVVKRNLS